ncbi:hypothetical protein AA0113_g1577 [Alternaria arborescens]|uniref:Uncharacterized protein n=1 Tax=Alternaria arborescens TaxID=156630 RepID=A0A4Q4SMP4_9PLEO|nr:hypothetical protein AA0112_g2160 [Alternaria arborescens]RYO71881.1 hypothetical protein AA0113_g1577 [Alternaria arborescens]
MWPFGSVPWYALCGEPPFRGTADSTGKAMFNNIVGTRKVQNRAHTKAKGKLKGHQRGYEEGYAQGKLEENERACSMGMMNARQEHQLRFIEAKRESRDPGRCWVSASQ